LTRWLLVCGGLYITTRILIVLIRRHNVPREWSLAGDALMFATSLLLLIAAWNPATMRAIGDTSSFLLFSGFVGLPGTTRALFHA
jgi:hypothetical protein